MWEYFSVKRARARVVSADAAKKKQEGTKGQWQLGSPFEEVLEQVNGSSDTYCDAYMMLRASYAVETGSWEGFKEAFRDTGEISEWAFDRIKEAYDKVASEDVGRLSIAQDILRKSTDFLRRVLAPVDGVGGITLSYVCPHCVTASLWRITSGRSSGHGDVNNRKKKCSWWCAACGGQFDWRAPNRILVIQLSANANKAKVFKAHAAPLGLCDDLINALKLLTNQQKYGDSPIQKYRHRFLHFRSRKGIMEGLRSSIEVDTAPRMSPTN